MSGTTTLSTDGLEVSDLVVRYGGLTAVDRVRLHAATGRLTGLIGPNGAGKTSTFNALTGLVRTSSGGITLFGEDVSSVSPQGRAQRGLGRTFQRLELFDSLTVAQNVALGREAHLAGSNPLRHLFSTGTDRRDVSAAVEDAIGLCGLGDLSSHPVAVLSTGQRRLVELARCIAGHFRILLLDEPSSGLDDTETHRFGGILRQLVDRGLGILLVEHDMTLIAEVCDHVYVIDFGKPLFDGPPDEVLAADIVRAAYLGTEPLEVA
jgi:ABC-type branched-subunit amino acid transport system ATPase component